MSEITVRHGLRPDTFVLTIPPATRAQFANETVDRTLFLTLTLSELVDVLDESAARLSEHDLAVGDMVRIPPTPEQIELEYRAARARREAGPEPEPPPDPAEYHRRMQELQTERKADR